MVQDNATEAPADFNSCRPPVEISAGGTGYISN